MRIIRTTRITTVAFYVIPLIAGILYLLAFYPGVLTFDSVHQWDQLTKSAISNWHPAYHTILMWLITRIWYSPAAVVLFQVVVHSLVLGYGFNIFFRQGIPFYILLLGTLIVSFVPIYEMMIVTLWKDVLYSLFLLLLTLYLYKMVQSKGAWITIGHNWVYFSITVMNVSLLRHNGFPVAFGVLIMCLIVFSQRKHFAKALVLSTILLIFFIGPVYKIFKVDNSFRLPAALVFIHPIAAHIDAGTTITSAEAELLNQIFSLEKGWPYSCYDATIMSYQGVFFQPVLDHPIELAKIFFRLTLKNPGVTLRHFFCLSSFLWQINQPKGVYLETYELDNINLVYYPNWKQYETIISQDPKLPNLYNVIFTIIDKLKILDRNLILWRPAIYLYTFLFVVVLTWFRSRNPFVFLLLIPNLIQSSIIALTTQLQALRYEFPVYLTTLVFSLPLLYLAVNKADSLGNEEYFLGRVADDSNV